MSAQSLHGPVVRSLQHSRIRPMRTQTTQATLQSILLTFGPTSLWAIENVTPGAITGTEILCALLGYVSALLFVTVPAMPPYFVVLLCIADICI
jgi:hypothetical protein